MSKQAAIDRALNECSFDLSRINFSISVEDIPSTYGYHAAGLSWPNGKIVIDDDDVLWKGYRDWLGRPLYGWRNRKHRKSEWARGCIAHELWHQVDWQVVTPEKGQRIANDVWGESTWRDPHRHNTAGLFIKAFWPIAQDAPFTRWQVGNIRSILG